MFNKPTKNKDANLLRLYFKYFLTAILLCASYPSDSKADARNSKFRFDKNSSQYAAIGATYKSDQNSKEYKISGSYQYLGERFLHEIDFLQHNSYSSSSSTQNNLKQTKNLYDGELSSKVIIGKSSNYFNYYNRTKYDSLSDYYYDSTNAIGWGRVFFGGILEADINVGYNNVKNFNSQIIINPNLKATFWLTNKIKFSTKAYIFQVQNSYYEELKSRISYKMTDNLSLEFYYNYDKKRFFYETSKVEETKTEVGRDLIARLRYDF